jgi:hypothetical protein
VSRVAFAFAFHFSLIDPGARETTIRAPMNAQHSGQKWFQCFSPDGLISRADAVHLIHKHAARARILEDLGARRLMMLTHLTDAQIRNELPTAWLREHQQADMFRDAASSVANDANYRAECRAKPRRTFKEVFVALFSWH